MMKLLSLLLEGMRHIRIGEVLRRSTRKTRKREAISRQLYEMWVCKSVKDYSLLLSMVP